MYARRGLLLAPCLRHQRNAEASRTICLCAQPAVTLHASLRAVTSTRHPIPSPVHEPPHCFCSPLPSSAGFALIYNEHAIAAAQAKMSRQPPPRFAHAQTVFLIEQSNHSAKCTTARALLRKPSPRDHRYTVNALSGSAGLQQRLVRQRERCTCPMAGSMAADSCFP